MIKNEKIVVGDKSLDGLKVEMPGASVLMIVGEKGFVGCGYFKVEVADKVGHALAIVSGVKSFEDVLAAKVCAISTKAAELGISEGMTGEEAAKLLA